jgi:hypothetical protein
VSEWDLWFDVSRLRPDEWEVTMAGAFLRPMNIQAEYHKGIDDANAEHKATRGQRE